MRTVKRMCLLFFCGLASCSGSEPNKAAKAPGKEVAPAEKTLADFNVRQLPVDYESPTVPYTAAVSNDGKLAAVAYTAGGGATSRVELWEADTAKLRWTFSGDHMGIIAVAFWPDEGSVLAACCEGVIRLLDAKTGKVVRDFKTNDYSLNSFALAPGGRFALTQGREVPPDQLEFPLIRLWDPKTGKLVREHQVLVQPGVSAVSADGKFALHGGFDGQDYVLTNLDNGEIIHIFWRSNEWCAPFAFVPDSKDILILRRERAEVDRLAAWDISTRRIERELHLKERDVRIVRGFRLARKQQNPQALVYYHDSLKTQSAVITLSWLDLKTGNEAKSLTLNLGGVYDPPLKVQVGLWSFSENTSKAFFEVYPRLFQVWDLEAGRALWNWERPLH